jgi:hypothetical protein
VERRIDAEVIGCHHRKEYYRANLHHWIK